MTNAKMKTSAPLTAEQIRNIYAANLQQRKRYLRIRSIVRFVFWGSLAMAALLLAAKYGLLPDDYRDTCESLGQTCKP